MSKVKHNLIFLTFLFTVPSYSAIWVEKTHNDFADGKEYYYRGGDTATYWTGDTLRMWHLGSRIYSPTEGGLRIIGQDWDLDDNDWIDVIFTPSSHATIFWNNTSGFNTSNKTELPIKGPMPQAVSLCDLDRDGKLEILIGERDDYWAYIYDGNTYSKYDSVNVAWGNQDLFPADLNNDGEIDLITPSQYWSYVYFGPGPFCTKLPMDTFYIPASAPGSAHKTTVADLNYDGFLDIVMSCQASKLYIYWGSPTGWTTNTLSCTYNYDHSIADLNKDGYLDIFVNTQESSNDPIFWGSYSGFTSTFTSGSGPVNCSVCDVNKDGALDIATNGEGIIWGPTYNNYTTLSTGSYVTEVADFNNDGNVDVLFGSYLYWNNSGFSSTNRFNFSSSSDDALSEDLGNLWDRSNKQKYLSSIFSSPDTIKGIDSIKWWGNIPQGMDVELWMRATLDINSWVKWIKLQNGGMDSSLCPSKYLQYRCTFSTDYKRTSLFSFDSVKVFYDTVGAGVEIEKEEYKDLKIYTLPFTKDRIEFIFELPTSGKLNMAIYNLAGERIKDLIKNKYYYSGKYQKSWDIKNGSGSKIKSGVYFCKLTIEGHNQLLKKTNKLVMLGE